MISLIARSRTVLAIVLCMSVVAGGCAAFDDDGDTSGSDQSLSGSDVETSTVCGRDVVPSPAVLPVDACQRGEVVLDDTFVKRTRGEPDEASVSFDLDTSSNICLQLDNIAGETPTGSNSGGGKGNEGSGQGNEGSGQGNEGNGQGNEGNGQGNEGSGQGNEGDGAGRLSAAWVYLDGELLVGPDDLDQDVDDLQRNLDLSSGQHEIRVKLASKPGAKLGVTLQAADLFEQADRQPTTTGENGILEVSNVAVDHPMVSPNGDGYHDTALFNADNLPDASQLDKSAEDYHLEWTWSLVDADSCSTVDAGLSGTTDVNSPTNVRAHWDGTDTSGSTVTDGSYLYEYEVDLVDSGGTVVDSATAMARGILVDSSQMDIDPLEFDDDCDPTTDPDDCKCPDQTPEGVRCTFGWIPYLDDFDDLSDVDTSKFITTNQQPSGRYEVVVDLRSYNAGGLVPQTNGNWSSLEDLRVYVSKLTGVPTDTDRTRLFNFDYVQLGYSTPVVEKEGPTPGFNHFLLDVITDSNGQLTIDGKRFDLRAMLDSSQTQTPDGYTIQNPRTGDTCAENGNTDGENTFRAKACTEVRTANLDPGGTNLGIYTLRSRMFDVRFDGEGTTRDTNCIINGIFKCGVRTLHRDADLTAAGQEYIESASGTVRLARDVETIGSETPSLVVHSDRHIVDDGVDSILDGVCSRSLASGDGMSTPLDTAAGAVSPTCIINGIF